MCTIGFFVGEHTFAFALALLVAVHFDFVGPLVRVSREGGREGGREISAADH